MTIQKHRPWGEDGTLDPSGVVITSDREGSDVVTRARARGDAPPMLGLVGGDLCATLGGSGSEPDLYTPGARRYPCDLGVAVADGVEYLFLAHVLVRRRWWRGRILAAMNAQWLGGWDLGPKSHPNDGLLDVSDATLPWSDKLTARKRARTGTHLPHPGIEVRRIRKPRGYEFDPPGQLYVDDVRVATVRHLELSVEPDALTVVI